MKRTDSTTDTPAGMLIINADDLGRDESETRMILSCYEHGRITSASAMMFMKDSTRAAALALETDLDVGLHLNFTAPFNDTNKSAVLTEYHQQIVTFLSKRRYRALLYNPFLKKCLDYTYKSQYEEFIRLYNREPTHIDGHHHMHLCMNMLVDRIIPKGVKVRRNFTFTANEKSLLNRLYRRTVDSWLARRYTCTDFFFSISPLDRPGRLQRIIDLATSARVELMVHPAIPEEYAYLMSDDYLRLISGVRRGTYTGL